MTEIHKDNHERYCPTCDYRGDLVVCPVDGSNTKSNPDEERVGGNTDSPEARAPTLAGVSEHPGEMMPSIPPNGPHQPGFALTHPDDAGDSLRGDEYGRWEAPEIVERQSGMVGRSIGGRYVIQGSLGQGGMGAVYLAEQPSVKRTVAIKVLHREYAESPSIVRRFHQEAMAASRLNHPNTISVYDFGQSDGLLYIAMEHLKGQTLHAATQASKGLSPGRCLNIMRQVLKSVGEAHRQGIIHRDLKPENIFLTEVGGETDFVKVLDFGVAKLRQPDEDQETLTQAGSVFGTPRYMAPEQSRDVPLDHRADLYSLGVIFYEILMGRTPFSSDNPLSVLLAHSSQPPPRFTDTRPDLTIPSAIEAVVFKALAKDRALRYQSADEMAEDIDQLTIALDVGEGHVDSKLLPILNQSLTAAGVTLNSDELAWAVHDEELSTERPSGHSGILWTLALAAASLAIGLWWISQGKVDSTTHPTAPVTTSKPTANTDEIKPTIVAPVNAPDASVKPPQPTPVERPRKRRRPKKAPIRKDRTVPKVETRSPRLPPSIVPKAQVIKQAEPVEASDPFDSLDD